MRHRGRIGKGGPTDAGPQQNVPPPASALLAHTQSVYRSQAEQDRGSSVRPAKLKQKQDLQKRARK
jgi:hypothetical protein